jgi:hypothetical protein
MLYVVAEESATFIRVASVATGSKARAVSSANVRLRKLGACPSGSALLVKTRPAFKVRRIWTPSARAAVCATVPRATAVASSGLKVLLVSA